MNTRTVTCLSLFLLLLLTAGCSESEKIAPGEQSGTEKSEDVWATQRQPIEKAKAVEQQLQAGDERLREQIEQESQ